MTISLNVSTSTQNPYATNTGSTGTTDTSANDANATQSNTNNFGPATIITLSANAELSLSQVADEYPDAPTPAPTPTPAPAPAPDEIVVVREERPWQGVSRGNPNSAASGGASFIGPNGWNETYGPDGNPGDYGSPMYVGQPTNTPPTEPPKPDEIVTVIANKLAPPPPVKDGKDPAFEYALEKIFNGQNGELIDALGEATLSQIANRPAEPRSRSYVDPSNGHLHLVSNKTDTLRRINEAQAVLGNISDIGFGNTLGELAANVFMKATLRGFLSSPFGVGVFLSAEAMSSKLEKYEDWVQAQPYDWMEDIDVTDVPGEPDAYQQLLRDYQNWAAPAPNNDTFPD